MKKTGNQKNRDLMMPEPMDKKTPERHEVDSAVDTLMRAKEIEKDQRLMPHVHKRIAEKHAAITSLKDMKKLAGKKKLEEMEHAAMGKDKESPAEDKAEM